MEYIDNFHIKNVNVFFKQGLSDQKDSGTKALKCDVLPFSLK